MLLPAGTSSTVRAAQGNESGVKKQGCMTTFVLVEIQRKQFCTILLSENPISNQIRDGKWMGSGTSRKFTSICFSYSTWELLFKNTPELMVKDHDNRWRQCEVICQSSILKHCWGGIRSWTQKKRTTTLKHTPSMAQTYFYIQKGTMTETPLLLVLLHRTSKFKHNVLLQIQSLQFITEYVKPSLAVFHFILEPIQNLPQGFGYFQSTM